MASQFKLSIIYRMIRNISEVKYSELLKNRLILVIARMHKSQLTNSIILVVLTELLLFVSRMSVLFLGDPLVPRESNFVFSVLTIDRICQLTGMTFAIIDLVLVSYLTACLVLLGLNFLESPYSNLVTAAAYGLKYAKLWSVGLAHYTARSISVLMSGKLPTSEYVIKLIAVVESVLVVGFVVLWAYLEIRPLRVNNLNWGYDNYKRVYRFILGLVRGLVFFADGPSIILLIVSLIAQYEFYKMPDTYLVPYINTIQDCVGALSIIAHVTLLLQYFSIDGRLLLLILSSGTVVCVVIHCMIFKTRYDDSFHIPHCTPENLAGLYNFYMQNVHNQAGGRNLGETLSTHLLLCGEQKCLVGVEDEEVGRLSPEDLEIRISDFMKRNKYTTNNSELLCELWNIELEKSISLGNDLDHLDLVHSYIVHYAMGAKEQETAAGDDEIKGSGGSAAGLKWKFYQQLSSAVDKFEDLSNIMRKSIPELNQIIKVITKMHKESENVHEIFSEMVDTKQINYICIELYLKFVESFLDESKFPHHIISRLRAKKLTAQYDSLEGNPQPCFLVEAYSKKIEKFNAQALKFMRMQRYELVNKEFNDIVVPKVNLKQLVAQIEKGHEKQELMPIFFKVSNSEEHLSCRNIKVKSLHVNNRSCYQIIVTKRINNSNIVQILIDNEQNIKASSKNVIYVPFRNGNKPCKVADIFEEKIKEVLEEVSPSKASRIEFGENCFVEGLILQKHSPYPNTRLLNINLVKKISLSRNNKKTVVARMTKVYKQSNKSSFFYYQNQHDRLTLQWSSPSQQAHQLSVMDNAAQIRNYTTKLGTIMFGLEMNRMSLVNDIKVYRLWDGELYNIDLEDKDKYVEQFDEFNTKKQEAGDKYKLNQKVIIVSLFLVTMAAIGVNLALYFLVDGEYSAMGETQNQLLTLEQYSIDFNRILSTLRDVSNGLFVANKRQFKPIIMDSYNQLHKFDGNEFLSNRKYIAEYTGMKYEGTLSELLEICLSHVVEFLIVMHDSIIESIHDYAIIELGPKLVDEKIEKQVLIAQSAAHINKMGLIAMLGTIALSALFFVMYVLLSYKYKKNMEKMLQPLLLISQHEIQRLSEQSEKFKNVITSLSKNYDVNMEALGSKKQEKKRSRPKKVDFGCCSIALEVGVGFFLMILLVATSFLQFNKISSQVYTNTRAFKQGHSVSASYSQMNWLSNQIEHTGIVNASRVQAMSQKLSTIENNKNNLQFSSELSAEVVSIFFEDSCALLVQSKIIEQMWCGTSMKGFSLSNPFGMGLDFYFRRLHYSLVTNVTDTFAATGLFSDPFKVIFKHLSSKIKAQIVDNLVSDRENILIFSVLVVISSGLLIVAVVATVLYYNSKARTISYGLVALRGYPQQESKPEEQEQSKLEEPDEKEGEKLDLLGSKKKDKVKQ